MFILLIYIFQYSDNEYSNVINAKKPLNLVSIWCGNFQTFALDYKGHLYSWGLNDVCIYIVSVFVHL